LDLGVSGVLPDAGLLVTWRPVRWLHAQAGGGFNIISPGLRAGVTAICPRILPFSLTAEAGHYFQGNANAVVNGLTGQGDDIAILRKVGYDYANVLLGLTSGGKRYVYYFRAGATFLRTTLSNFQETVGQIAATPVEASDLHLSYHGPTVKFGMIAFY
jgi:hypothetical protein